MSVSIVLGCADRGVAEQFRTRLAENVDLELVEIVEDGRDLLQAVDRGEADVLVLHEGLGPVPALEQVREIAMARPYLGIVFMAADARPEIYAQAMEAGARSVLTAPYSLEELTDRIDAAAGWGRLVRSHLAGEILGAGGERSRVVTVSGAKGGVGSSVVAAMLAHAAQRSGRSTVLVDFDLQNGDVAHLLGIQARRSIVDLAEVAGEINVRSLNEIAYRDSSGLAVLVAPEHGERAEDMTARAARLILSALRLQYDLVVVDCGAHVDDAVAVAVEQSETRLLLVTPDVPTLRAARRRLDLWQRLQIAKPEDVTVVFNRHSRKREIQPDGAAHALGLPLARTTIPLEEREMEELVNTSRVTDAPAGRAVRAVVALAEELDLLAPAQEPRRGARRRRRDESGQVMVETPVVIGLLLLFAMFLFQMLAWGWTHLLAENTAQEAARVAAVDDDTAACRAAEETVTLGWDLGACSVDRSGDRVRVELTTPTVVPGLDGLRVRMSTSFLSEQ